MKEQARIGQSTPLIVNTLGVLDIQLHGKPVLRWPAGRSRSLFLYLLLHRNQRVTTDRLYDALWPETARRPGGSSLKVACHGVRQALGAVRDESGPIRLRYHEFGYVLEIDEVRFDADDFIRLVQSGSHAAKAGNCWIARRDLTGAMQLYRGDYLESDTADWAISYREYLKSMALCALQELQRIAEDEDDIAQVISLCVRIIDLDQYHEPSYQKLMALHGERGELERAYSWFRLCAERLRENLGVEPSVETVSLFRRIFATPVDFHACAEGIQHAYDRACANRGSMSLGYRRDR
ncbi:AfsR/SARP family transcriptional regulator [Nocardia heshunensis]